MKRFAFLILLSSTMALAQPSMPRKVRLPDEPPAAAERLAAAIGKRDVKTIKSMLNKSVRVHGIWFPDATCAKRFGTERTFWLAGDRAAFAGCLAKLKLQATTRTSPNRNAQVLTYAPGMEIEVAFQDGALYYAGYLHARPSPTPTLTAQAFEALRTGGSTNVDKLVAAKLDPVIAKSGGQVYAWLEVCLDAKATPSVTVAEASSREVGEAFTAAVADWTFKPFLRGKTAVPVCTQSLLTYPAAKVPNVERLARWSLPSVWDLADENGVADGVEGGEVGGVEGGVVGGEILSELPPPPPPPPPAPPQNVPPTLLEANRISGNKLIVPEESTKKEIVKSGKDKIIGSYKLCITVGGNVASVSQLKSTGFPAYDTKIQSEMKTWAYRPYLVNGKAVPVCTAVTFIYTQK
jgi:hypothetical protein